MQQDVFMPSLGLTMEEGTVIEWFVSVGDKVDLGADFFLLETEKSEVEIEAPYEGVLAEIVVEAGRTVAVGAVIARMEVDQVSNTTAAPVPTPLVAVQSGVQDVMAKPAVGKIRATPLARRLAVENKVDLTALVGSGPFGRIKRCDVERGVSESVIGVTSPITPLEGRRALIAARMSESTSTTASVTLATRAKVAQLISLRECLVAAQTKVRPSYNDVIVVACAVAIAEHPDIILQIHAEALHLPENINIGLAVQAPEGLIVPIIRDADTRSILDVAVESERLIEDALQNRLHPFDAEEGVFTVSNLGAEGIDAFTPLINLPQSAVLGVGAIRDSVEVVDGAPFVIPMLTLSLTFDHRAIDGQPAARFLKRVVELLECPDGLRTGLV